MSVASSNSEPCKHIPKSIKTDLTGRVFGKLEVMRYAGSDQTRNSTWECKCACGNIVKRASWRLKKIKENEGCNQCNTNTFIDMGDYILATTAKGEEFIFDKDDYDRVKQFSWFMVDGYPTARKKKIMLHRFILGEPPNGLEIDHINRNRADNRKDNLRFATRAQNIANTPKAKGKSSKYKGVTWLKDKNLWCAKIFSEGKNFYICRSKSEEKCAIEYNKKAFEIYGEYALLNDVQSLTTK
jgi:hypothetical protein